MNFGKQVRHLALALVQQPSGLVPARCTASLPPTRDEAPFSDAHHRTRHAQAYQQYQNSQQQNQGNQQQQQGYGGNDSSDSPYPSQGGGGYGQQQDFTGGRQHAGSGSGEFGIQGGAQFNSHDNRPPQQSSGASRPPPLPRSPRLPRSRSLHTARPTRLFVLQHPADAA